MDSISISRNNTESAVSEIVGKIRTEVIKAAEDSEKTIINAIERSSGEFIDSLKEQIVREGDTVREAGELLIAVAEYVRSAAAAFADVDRTYSTSKIQ